MDCKIRLNTGSTTGFYMTFEDDASDSDIINVTISTDNSAAVGAQTIYLESYNDAYAEKSTLKTDTLTITIPSQAPEF